MAMVQWHKVTSDIVWRHPRPIANRPGE
jgi:hypothetical protein